MILFRKRDIFYILILIVLFLVAASLSPYRLTEDEIKNSMQACLRDINSYQCHMLSHHYASSEKNTTRKKEFFDFYDTEINKLLEKMSNTNKTEFKNL